MTTTGGTQRRTCITRSKDMSPQDNHPHFCWPLFANIPPAVSCTHASSSTTVFAFLGLFLLETLDKCEAKYSCTHPTPARRTASPSDPPKSNSAQNKKATAASGKNSARPLQRIVACCWYNLLHAHVVTTGFIHWIFPLARTRTSTHNTANAPVKAHHAIERDGCEIPTRCGAISIWAASGLRMFFSAPLRVTSTIFQTFETEDMGYSSRSLYLLYW